jgi:hypothetical protein
VPGVPSGPHAEVCDVRQADALGYGDPGEVLGLPGNYTEAGRMSDPVTITVSRYHAELIELACREAENGVRGWATVHDPDHQDAVDQAGRLWAAYRVAREQVARALGR